MDPRLHDVLYSHLEVGRVNLDWNFIEEIIILLGSSRMQLTLKNNYNNQFHKFDDLCLNIEEACVSCLGSVPMQKKALQLMRTYVSGANSRRQ
ncbi:hypothetical protein OROMI_023702 [Orobanche minor]